MNANPDLTSTINADLSTIALPSPRNPRGTRTGYTTGSNAAAAAKAATIALLTGKWPASVTITLPKIGDLPPETTTMTLVQTERDAQGGWAACGVIKDAGDDPDVTHGALICARVAWSAQPGIHIEGGIGVGRVTLPGLGLPVGGPAINPVPRQQIYDNVQAGVEEAKWQSGRVQVAEWQSSRVQRGQLQVTEENEHPATLQPATLQPATLHPATLPPTPLGLTIIISVPKGQELAKRTLNARLGILGGISILGTSGKVFPYSTAAWRASVVQAVEMAANNSRDIVVMATGGRSERFAMHFFPHLPATAFVELSIFTGDAIRTCVEQGVKNAVFVGMIGKMIKTAQGHMQTHVAANQVDFAFLAQVCRDVGSSATLIEAVAKANTGRHFLELCQSQHTQAPLQRVVDLALAQCLQFSQKHNTTNDKIPLGFEVILVDFDGTVLARAAQINVNSPAQQHHHPQTLVERLAANPSAAYSDDETPIEIEDGA
ncbi:MAG: cobalt-precorrin-5B (C(1))-methyltransferase [Anaerolineae bacterium]|nr:cobalt-precorrin-5B (C(1))-methyltransferase [Anaerolineae bacterium]